MNKPEAPSCLATLPPTVYTFGDLQQFLSKNEITKRVCGYQDTESKLTFHKECGCLWVRRF